MKKKLLLSALFCFIFIFIGCSDNSSSNNEVTLYMVEKDQSIAFGNHSGTTHKITEFHCIDLGDSYYEANFYKTYYFSNHLYPFNTKTSEEIIEIIKKGTYTPTYTEKLITIYPYSTSFSDGITHQDVVLYVSEKVKNESFYYGINR